jgi:hypothetical protein
MGDATPRNYSIGRGGGRAGRAIVRIGNVRRSRSIDMVNITVEQVLQLAEELTPAERSALVESLQLTSNKMDVQDADSEWADLLDQMAGGMDDDPM